MALLIIRNFSDSNFKYYEVLIREYLLPDKFNILFKYYPDHPNDNQLTSPSSH